MSRAEFSRATKEDALNRANGKCECGCGKPLYRPEFHHIVEAAIDGGNDLGNCLVINEWCHLKITRERSIPEVAKTKRIREKNLGLRAKTRSPMAGSRRSGWKRRMDGSVERR